MGLRATIPFAVAATGVLLDVMTTTIGFSIGLHEKHPGYNPFLALIIFWSMIALTRILPQTKSVRTFTTLLSLVPFLAVVNNSLVIMGIFSGF